MKQRRIKIIMSPEKNSIIDLETGIDLAGSVSDIEIGVDRHMNATARLTFHNVEVEAEANVEEETTVRYRHLEK